MSAPQPMKVGMIGAGNVAPLYLPNLLPAPGIEVAAISDLVPTVAAARAAEYGISTVLTPEQVIADPAIELVLNFTPIPAHAETTRRALAAGKHVYSEKPLATSTAEAVALVEEAERRGLRLGCAPDTLLGSGLQVARATLEGGAVGRPLGAGAFMFRRTSPTAGYATGAFAFRDMAPYYVTTLVTLFGPARRVVGLEETLSGSQAEASFQQTPISFGGVIEFDGRLLATLVLAWGTDHRAEVPSIHVYGTRGDLSVPNPNVFGEATAVRLYTEPAAQVVEGSVQPPDWPRQQRGLGVAEMAEAIREGRQPRAAGDLAAHVVEVIEGIVASSEQGRPVDLETRFVLPPPLPPEDRARLLGR